MTRKDLNQTAFSVVQQATGEEPIATPTPRQVNSRKGGLVGGAVRATVLSPEQRKLIAKKAAAARWKPKP